jgi:hypothetical protein
MSHNPMGLHGLLRGYIYLLFYLSTFLLPGTRTVLLSYRVGCPLGLLYFRLQSYPGLMAHGAQAEFTVTSDVPAARYASALSIASRAAFYFTAARQELRFRREFQIRVLSHKSENSERKSTGIVGSEIR